MSTNHYYTDIDGFLWDRLVPTDYGTAGTLTLTNRHHYYLDAAAVEPSVKPAQPKTYGPPVKGRGGKIKRW